MKNTRTYLAFSGLVILLNACTPDKPTVMFTRMESTQTNIDFQNTLIETMELNIFTYDYLYNGAGVAAADFNNDGLNDLYFVGNTDDSKLYLNEGDFEFEDITADAGVQGRKGWKTGVSVADVNGDGWQDIYVCYSGTKEMNRTNELFINSGGEKPTFTERAIDFGLDADSAYSTQATFFDYDLDGDLDMFLLNHGLDYKSSYTASLRMADKRHPEHGNRLYRNDSNKFVEVSEVAGIHGGWLNYGLSVSVSDFNGDGYPDLYVSNDFDERDFFYINNGDGTFSEKLKESFSHISKYTMGSDAADINNDNLPDLVTLDMLPHNNYRKKLLKGPDSYDQYTSFVNKGYHKQQMRNMLQLNRGSGPDGLPVFSEIGQFAGISSTDWSWSSLFADLDNDGRRDLFVTNGYLRDLTNLDFQRYDFEGARKQAIVEGIDLLSEEGRQYMFNLITKMESIKVSKFVFQNQNGLRFQDVTQSWGLQEPLIAAGAAYVDLDNDGDLDMVTNNVNDKASVYRNNSETLTRHHFLKVKLEGEGANKNGIGTKVYVSSASQQQFAEAYVARGYLSTVTSDIHFGLGKDSVVNSLTIEWNNGTRQTLKNLSADTTIVVRQSDASKISKEGEAVAQEALLADVTVSSGLDFVHRESNYVDFKHERLLLENLSDQGPRMATGDVDGDGLDDVFIGGATGQGGRLFVRKADGSFIASKSQPWEADKDCEDTDAVFIDADRDGDLDLLVTSGGTEFPEGSPKLLDRLYLNTGAGRFSKGIVVNSSKKGGSSCAVAEDYDQDGDKDLFIGGWVRASAFPTASCSFILRNDSRKGEVLFTPADSLTDLGIVTDAVWSDIDQDGWKDLIVVGLWMPVRIFKNEKGVLRNTGDDYGLNQSGGLWNVIEAADFDGDGDDDYLVGNLGTNGELPASADAPLEIYYNDFDKNGEIDPIICYREDGKTYPVATRDDIISQIPSLKKKFLRYEQYAGATIADLLTTEQLRAARKGVVHGLQSVLMVNEGKKFTMIALPDEVQFSPVQGIVTGHFNSDQHLDALLVGNLLDYRVEYGPFDASLGALLLGKGDGKFHLAGARERGVMLKGDLRDACVVNDRSNGRLCIISVNNDRPQVLRMHPGTTPSVLASQR